MSMLHPSPIILYLDQIGTHGNPAPNTAQVFSLNMWSWYWNSLATLGDFSSPSFSISWRIFTLLGGTTWLNVRMVSLLNLISGDMFFFFRRDAPITYYINIMFDDFHVFFGWDRYRETPHLCLFISLQLCGCFVYKKPHWLVRYPIVSHYMPYIYIYIHIHIYI